MIDQSAVIAIGQKKLDSLAAKHLHVKRIKRLGAWSMLVDFIALGVPSFYFAFRYLAKGTPYSMPVEIVWEVLAGILLCVALWKLVFKWQDRLQTHSKLVGANIALAGEADSLLAQKDQLSPESARLFILLAEKSEIDDREALGEPKLKDKQYAYREALKEYSPGELGSCPACKTSAWCSPGWLTSNACSLCGNKPANST